MNSGDEEQLRRLPEVEKIQVYGVRWLVLGLFVLYSAINAMQWIQFSIINDVIVKYYGVSSMWVDWTSMIYMVLYIPFVFPASYLLEKLGLRKAVIIGMLGTCIGSWIKVGAVSQDRFYIAFLGQTVVGFSQIFVLSVPARLAAVWFGPSQVSSACSIGVFGNQLGVALGFLLPPIFVSSDLTIDEMTHQFYVMYISVAAFTTVLLLAILLLFKDKPPIPPSHAALQQDSDDGGFMDSLKTLLKNRSFMLLLMAYGINVGAFYAISTLLNQIVLSYYPNASTDAGRIGLVIVVAGMMGSVCCGIVLDKYHKFKETTLIVYGFTLISMVLYTFTISKGILVVYAMSALLGFFMTGLLPVGFELAAELTYPTPEGTSAGLLNCACNALGIIFTNIYSLIFNHVNDVWANIATCLALGIGTILLAYTKSDLKRQAAQIEKNSI
ncbi:uncharacterized MFS-type transporter C09D4.1 isoform X1 [Diorhabda sublineata]|uniref:uncharacterized MFS-type transporter C09D4.1 isoform X1 n=2 Tax=Diorhabda sublineata TaxID=1163346 RepID=UPI0024E0E7E9|nr:uncharacterized MFS-type transporter C09D4.1 isoform X1 [Diorhabda sublineata]XP_056638277.1 uncharacterized MFS-type transporter C09D4.1 isoform X1 [Diorhabda sublineata]XP_056638285.1 uncharacterized MFS-type transporter C09D4.1 isoform X1 [Diorhabda sublineata]XP_056638292.1 uncharacterized MFS-type transporter C09D4.1 isoform X1 [Diorhabda sublineata]XP_056638300.1 uncharacterized MFS-type transporter C09D4.1 isoform X1 [Diorhabda sublineata]XP_056638308.1 uncharacterized MFS-type trans